MREDRIPGMRECQVCGRPFPLVAESHYVARDCDYVGLEAVFGNWREPMLYDAIDCPHCGCQNVMRKRKRPLTPEDDPKSCADCCGGCSACPGGEEVGHGE